MAQAQQEQQKLYVTRTGLPLAITLKWPFRPSNSGADFWVMHSDLRLVSEPALSAAVSVNLAATLREALGELTVEKCESPVLSCLRKEVDNHQIEFLKSGKLLPVNFGSRHYSLLRKEWTFGAVQGGDRGLLLRRKAYWLSKAGEQAWMADPADAMYLAATPAELMMEAQGLAAAGLIKLSGEYAEATVQLREMSAEIEGDASKALEELQLKHAYERG